MRLGIVTVHLDYQLEREHNQLLFQIMIACFHLGYLIQGLLYRLPLKHKQLENLTVHHLSLILHLLRLQDVQLVYQFYLQLLLVLNFVLMLS